MNAPFEPRFSFQTRKDAVQRLAGETFDFLIIGGGITGASVARDAVSRGFKVALVEQNDFASGTSSGSSKLIHGGLRYLENYEIGLVFESLSERALLLKTAPHMVRPLPFYMPVFEESSVGMPLLSAGLWLYDVLSLFRTPGFHKRLSAKDVGEELPALNTQGLKGGFRYYDASMWDDMLTVETLRAAVEQGAVAANYVKAELPEWEDGRIIGFRASDNASPEAFKFTIKAERIIVCAGPWTDMVGESLVDDWSHWLMPSKGIHLVFELSRFPLPGAVTMTNPADGRVAFAIPRPDLGDGVVIAGTTDSPTPKDPAQAEVDAPDADYVMTMLNRYFPGAALTMEDVVSSYVGVRPLFQPARIEGEGASLQKISREHHIGVGPGGVTMVAGGKYTTARKMAEEIVDFTIKKWKRDSRDGRGKAFPQEIRKPETRGPINPKVMPEAVESAREAARGNGWEISEAIWDRFGAEALEIKRLDDEWNGERRPDPEGFPLLIGQLRHMMQNGMVVKLEDFWFRRTPLFLARRDHGEPWLSTLALCWATEQGFGKEEAVAEAERVRSEIARRHAWTAGTANR